MAPPRKNNGGCKKPQLVGKLAGKGKIPDTAEYEVEKILAVRNIKGKKEYLIKWKNWDDIWNEWVKEDNLSCDDILNEFRKKRELKSERKTSGSNAKSTINKVQGDDDGNIFNKLLDKSSNGSGGNKRLKLDNSSHVTTNNNNRQALFSPSDSKPVDFTDEAFESDLKNFLRKYEGKWYVKKTKIHSSVSSEKFKGAVYLVKKRDEKLLNGGLSLKKWQKKAIDKLLKQWENSIRRKCENYGLKPIKVVNEVDLTPPPSNFEFIVDNTWGPGVTIDKESVVGCCCGPFCSSKTACCPSGMDAEFAYRHKDKLRPGFRGKPIFECNQNCKCDIDCPNRTVQRRRQLELCIFRTNGRGWGLKTLEPIKKDSFVIEYVGEVITNEEADKRYNDSASQPEYLFDLDYHDWSPDFVIDATHYGNESHFVNHSCEPNLIVYSAYIDHLDVRLPRIALFARRDIASGEELTFDYAMALGSDGNTENEERQRNGSPNRSNRIGGQTECLCGSNQCRGYVFKLK